MSAPWETVTGAGVAAQLSRLQAESMGRARIVLVQTPTPNDLATWAFGAAHESQTVAVIDVSTLASGTVTMVTQGMTVDVCLSDAPDDLRRALFGVELLCVHGLDVAFETGAAQMAVWLAWCARVVPLTMAVSASPHIYLHHPALRGLSMRSDLIVDTARTASARLETVALLNRLLERRE